MNSLKITSKCSVYLIQDNMIRRAMRRAPESARRLDARYDVWAVFF